MSIPAKIVICLLFMLAGFAGGLKWEKGQEAQRQSDAKSRVISGAVAQVAADDKAGAARAGAAVVYRNAAAKTVEKIRYETIQVPVYRDCRVPDDGLRDLSDLISAANIAVGPDAAVPGAAGAR